MSLLLIILLIIMGWLNLTALIWNGRLKAALVDVEVGLEKNTNQGRDISNKHQEILKKFEELDSKVASLGKLYKNSPRSK
jgi:hypothetical protein